jgi:hypothetical protein
VYWATAKDAWHARRWRDKLLVWLKPPGWRPVDVAERFPKQGFDIQRERFLPVLSRGLVFYSIVQFALMLGMAVQFLDLAKRLPAMTLIGYAAFLVLSLTALGALTEGRRIGVALELTRLLATAAVPLVMGGWFGVPHLDIAVVAVLVAIPVVSALVLAWLTVSAAGRENHGNAVPN